MRFPRPRERNAAFWLKALGTFLLPAYLSVHPPFVDMEGIGVYLALALGAGILFAFIARPAHARPAPGRSWPEALLALGEDGLCFVPLLLAGVNPVTAEVAAVAFGALHYPDFPLRQCVCKGIHVFLVALLILPYGLGTVVVGHILVLALAYHVRGMGFLRPVVSPSFQAPR